MWDLNTIQKDFDEYFPEVKGTDVQSWQENGDNRFADFHDIIKEAFESFVEKHYPQVLDGQDLTNHHSIDFIFEDSIENMS